MLLIEFGKSEKTTLDVNSMFIIVRSKNEDEFKECVRRIKAFHNRVYIKETHEWEIPYCYYKDIMELFKDTEVVFRNEPPKAQFVTYDDILKGLDFNGYTLYDYQLEGVKYGLDHQSFLLLDEQRIRKNTSGYSIS